MPLDLQPSPSACLVDRFGRQVTYLRLSVTDRCDLRCTYCMSERMRFVPRAELLSLEEMALVAEEFIRRGVRKIRVTGGEPLVRRDVMSLFGNLSRHLDAGALDELTLTTNGTQLARFARDLAACGVRRVNVSLDTLDPVRYHEITRFGRIDKVLAGLDAALVAGLKVKLNAIASRGAFENEVDDLIRFAHGHGMDLTLIEEMPLGEDVRDRAETFLPLTTLEAALASRWTLTPLSATTGGPARYLSVAETGGRVGLISPLSCNFCAACNRLRVSATGTLYPCMGDEGGVDLRPALRAAPETLEARIRAALLGKPSGHRFDTAALGRPSLSRHMSALGG
jgi:cyclic pyranopterin phosphate synthase